MAQETKVKQAPKEEEIEELAVPEEEPGTELAEKQVPSAEMPAEEEAVAEAKIKKKKKDEEIVEERFYTIPLSRALVRPPKKRAPRAIQLLKEFVNRHMKMALKVSEEDDEELPQLIISKEVNEKIWDRGIEKPPRKIKTRITKDKDGNVTVYLAETQ